ncbi:MAG: N-acetylmuramoyl-L-alanine amidase-like domain-containing protein [Bacteroidota bacterium]
MKNYFKTKLKIRAFLALGMLLITITFAFGVKAIGGEGIIIPSLKINKGIPGTEQALKLPGSVPADTIILKKLFKSLKPHAKLPFPALYLKAAEFFTGTPYHAGTLDPESPYKDREHTVFYLHGLDCVTLIDNCLAAARCAANGKTTTGDFLRELEQIRYRSGVCLGYSTRLHYTTDLFFDNTRRRRMIYVFTPPLAIRLPNKCCMPGGCDVVAGRAPEDSIITNMLQVLDAINARPTYFIPTNKLNSESLALLQAGDIIGMTSVSDGLDVHHLGVLVKKPDGLHVLHASSFVKKVTVSKLTLIPFLEHNTSYSGIIAMRPML